MGIVPEPPKDKSQPSLAFLKDVQPIKLKAEGILQPVSFWLGFTTAVSALSVATLLFILFCPVWKELTNPVQPIVLQPNIYAGLVPVPSMPLNKSNEIPRKVSPLMPEEPPAQELAPAPAPPVPNE